MAAVTAPNLGLFFDRPPINIPAGGLRDGKNFRCKNGTLESLNLGWTKFSDDWVLNGPVVGIDNFFPRDQDEKLIFMTGTDIYLYDPNADEVNYLTPRYATGTASATGTAVTGVGTSWSANIEAGDEISFGSNAQDDPDATWYVIASVGGNTSITLESPGVPAPVTPAGQYTIRRLFQGATVASWAFDTFVNDGDTGDDLWFATNGLDPVVTWNGTDATVTSHPEQQFVCLTLTTYSNMMIYGNVTQAGDSLPTTIINSDLGLPLHAGATGTGISEQFVAHSNTDEILNMIPIGDYLVIYSERTIVPIQFVGDPLIFIFRVAISGVGPISGNAIADFGDFHEFLGSDAGYLFDGVTLKETNTHVWRDILRQTDPVRRREAYGHFNEEQGDLIWSIPNNSDPGVGEAGSPPTLAWTEHYLEDVDVNVLDGSPFSKRDFPFTATGFYQRQVGLTWDDADFTWQSFNFAWNDQFFQTAFPLNIAGDENGQVWVFDNSQTADGNSLPSFARTGRFALRSGRERDLLTRVYPYARSLPYNLEVGLYMADFVAGPSQPKGTQLFDMNLVEGRHFVTFYRRGRVAEFQFGSSAGNPWVLDGWDYDSVPGGMR